MGAAVQAIIADAVLRAGHIADVEVGAVNTASREIIIEIRIGKTRRQQQVLLNPGFSKGMNVEQVVIGALSIGDLLIDRLARELIDLKRIIQLAGVVSQADTKLSRLDVMRNIELKHIAMLIDIIERRANASHQPRISS